MPFESAPTLDVFRANAERNHQTFLKDMRDKSTKTVEDEKVNSGDKEEKQASSASTTQQGDDAKDDKPSSDYVDGWLRLN
ncbi:hypothetical protein LTR86_009022 [Recurvomyces mirabilis]|nr:hypothetical protein LTR86_009022 [Recurvomyces mirabilis]